MRGARPPYPAHPCRSSVLQLVSFRAGLYLTVERFVHHPGMAPHTVRYDARLPPAVVEEGPFIGQRKVMAHEVAEASLVAAANVGDWNRMATFADALAHA